jgi:hypothetical protein
MMKTVIGAVASVAMLLAALPASAVPKGIGGKVYELKAVGGSGEFGTVALKPVGGQTAVEVHVVNVPPDEVQTIHIHHGTCAKLDPPIVYRLSPLVDGTSETIIDVPLSKILATPSVIHVHRSYADEQRSIGCANLGPG